MISRLLRRICGFVEHLFLFGTIAWLVVLATHLLLGIFDDSWWSRFEFGYVPPYIHILLVAIITGFCGFRFGMFFGDLKLTMICGYLSFARKDQ